MYDQIILDNEKLVPHYIVNTRYKHGIDLYDVGLIGLTTKGVKSFRQKDMH